MSLFLPLHFLASSVQNSVAAPHDHSHDHSHTHSHADPHGNETHCCDWRGCFAELQTHILITCPLRLTQCRYSVQGCPVVTKQSLLPKHEEFCQYRNVSCTNNCGRIVIAKNLQSHLDSCPLKRVVCDRCHKHECSLKELDTHKALECEESDVCCRYMGLGCSWRGPRSQAAQHVQDNAFHHLKLAEKHMSEQTREIVKQNSILSKQRKQMKTALGFRLRWTFARDDLTKELSANPTSAQVLSSEWRTDCHGVKWQMRFEADPKRAGKVGLFVYADHNKKTTPSKVKVELQLFSPRRLLREFSYSFGKEGRGFNKFCDYSVLTAGEKIDVEVRILPIEA